MWRSPLGSRLSDITDSCALPKKTMCRSRGTRTPSPPWQGGILTIILRPRNCGADGNRTRLIFCVTGRQTQPSISQHQISSMSKNLSFLKSKNPTNFHQSGFSFLKKGGCNIKSITRLCITYPLRLPIIGHPPWGLLPICRIIFSLFYLLNLLFLSIKYFAKIVKFS